MARQGNQSAAADSASPTNTSGGRLVTRMPTARPATAARHTLGAAVSNQIAVTIANSATPCSHSAWLLVDQLPVANAKIAASTTARGRLSVLRNARNISATAALVTVEAANFSIR